MRLDELLHPLIDPAAEEKATPLVKELLAVLGGSVGKVIFYRRLLFGHPLPLSAAAAPVSCRCRCEPQSDGAVEMPRQPRRLLRMADSRLMLEVSPMGRTTSVEDYFSRADRWRDGLRELRRILLACGLEETIKWGAPVYARGGSNVVGLSAFKSYFGLWFFQGALLEDPDGVLVNAQAGRTKAMRQWRFTDEVVPENRVTAYVQAAVENADRGVRIAPERGKPVVIPRELADALAVDSDLEAAFDGLSLGKQREYAEHVAEAKQEATKQRRIAKMLPKIRAGLGLNDAYR